MAIKCIITPDQIPGRIYDFAFCETTCQLAETIRQINKYRYCLVSVTQDASGVYTVFFRRHLCRKDMRYENP